MAYLAADDFNPALAYLAAQYPTMCDLVTLAELTHERRTVQGLRVGKPATRTKRAILLIGGCHARELVNPDLLLSFAGDLLRSYTLGTDLTYGGRTYTSLTVRLVLDVVDIFIVPLINPDGRAFVQASPSNAWWRKNRSPNAGSACLGVDLNRNFDFLWSSGLGTSTDPCDFQIYRGSATFSEPEARNVRALLDMYPAIEAFVDVHSYMELVLHPWGDDELQTTDPAMNFRNPAFDGQRGAPGDAYSEYILAGDLERFEYVGARVRDAIHKVRGHCYTVKSAYGLYPTSGTSKDYAYSRHLVEPAKTKVLAYTFETGLEFQPPAAEAAQVIAEGSAGLFEFCIAVCCPIIGRRRPPDCVTRAGMMDLLADTTLARSAIGIQVSGALAEHFSEIRELIVHDRRLFRAAARLVRELDEVAQSHAAAPGRPVPARRAAALDKALAVFEAHKTMPSAVAAAVRAARDAAAGLSDRTLMDVLGLVGTRQAVGEPS